MRKFGIIVGIIVIVIVAAAAIFIATFNVNRYRGKIQADLTQRLARNVTLGDMHLSVFPPRFIVHNVSIADDPRFDSQRPFVQAQELDISAKLLPLLHKRFEISSLYLQRPSVELIKSQQGVWNFSSLGKPSSPPPSATQPAPQPTTVPPSQSKPTTSAASVQNQFSLNDLVIQDGQVATTDLQTRQPRTVYDHIDLTLKDFAPNRPFSIQAAAHLPGPGNPLISLTGDGGPIRQDQPAATPFHGTVNLQRVDIAGARQFLQSPALAKIDGNLSGQTRISSDGVKLAANGDINAQNVRMHGRDLGYPINVQYKIADEIPADLLTIESSTIKLGTTPLSITGTVNSKPTTAQIDLHAGATNVSIAEAAKLASSAGATLTPNTNLNGTVSADVRARGPADNPALNGTISAHDLQASGKDFPQPVQVKSIVLHLAPAEIHSDPFTVNSGATAMNVQFALQNYVSKNAIVNATVRAPNAELAGLLTIAKAYGVTALDNVSGAGILNVDLHATGPVRSINSADLARSLNGLIALNLQDVRYSGADISHELSTIAGGLGMHQSDQGYTTIPKMTGNIAVKNGIAQTNNTQALLDLGNVGIAGTASLVDQALNLRVTAVMSKELTQKVGGTNIGGYAKTVLANSQGELTVPATVTGTFQHPHFAPDLQQLAQMKLKGLMPDFNNPTATVAKIVGGLLNSPNANTQQPNPEGSADRSASPNPVQQLFGIFGKKLQPPGK